VIAALDGLGAITLFTEDLARTAAFYRDVFGLALLFEDDTSAVFGFGATVINVLQADAAHELIEPAPVGGPDAGRRVQLTIWVESLSSFPIYLKYPPCLDHLYVTLSTPDGTALPNGGGYLVNSCNSYIEFGYQYMSFDVTSQLQAYAGQRLILTLRGTTTNETVLPGRGYTGWAMDDIALTVS